MIAKQIALFLITLSVCLPNADAQATQEVQQPWPGKQSQWAGFERYDFKVDGRAAYVVEPRNPAPGKPWVWRARFPNFHADADVILLQRGFHVVRINTDGMLGSPRAMAHWDAFYKFLTERGLPKRCALEGVSRGGLFVYGFASRWPERVACVYADTPVGDVRSWPGGKGTGRGHEATWKTCLKEYGLTEETAKTFAGNPIDLLEPIAKAKIPLLHIVSLSDVIVPPTENTFVLAKRYQKLGGSISVMRVKEGTEKSGGHHFTHPDPVRVADFIERHASIAPNSDDYFQMRGSLQNCKRKFETTGKGRVAFLGGSITKMDNGWRDMTMAYLKKRFPKTEFDFIDAGIPSTGSTPGAFHLERDVLSRGTVDLLFEEAAVNDLHNFRTATEMTRGMEGIVRHARTANPNMDVVVMHFVDPRHMTAYRAGKVPEAIQQHEAVATHYGVPTLHLAKEVTERIDAGQFDWKNDFKNLHPSPYGHRVYAASIRRLLSHAWDADDKFAEPPVAPKTDIVPHKLPEPLDRFSYDGGSLVSIEHAEVTTGFKTIPKCNPRAGGVGGGVRPGFHNVPMLVGTKPGDEFKFDFTGRGVGLFVVAGPDAGTIAYSIDDGPWQQRDLFTKWSKGLHLPWAYTLATELPPGPHSMRVRIADARHKRSKGSVCRVVNILVNK